MAPYYVNRTAYRSTPRFDLTAVNVIADDYEQGELENWIPSVLTFNGRSQYAYISHADLTAPYNFSVTRNGEREAMVVSGDEIASPNITRQNMLIEAYFMTSPRHVNGVIVSKMGEAGYELAVNADGGATFTVKGGGTTASLSTVTNVNDGGWHHLIAEIDRDSALGALYLDGVLASVGQLALPAGSSLGNESDFLVGKGTDGRMFTGAIDFLRVCQGTLADAHTTIDELYDWEFDGPFLRDFAGNEPEGESRDAGAFEYTEGAD
jgi:hypothetical protein